MAENDDNTPTLDPMKNLVQQRYGDRLSEAELAEVLESIEGVGKMISEMRKAEVGYGDEPFSVFKPYRQEE